MKKTTGEKIAAMLMLASIAAYVSAAQTSVWFEGRPLAFDIPPRVMNGITFVQYGPVAEASGASMSWEPASGRITVRAGEASVVMTVGSTAATVNGRRVNAVKNNRVYDLDSNLFDPNPGVPIIDALEELAGILYKKGL